MESFAIMMGPLAVLATAVMAASGAIQGARHRFDLFGAVVLALATALGGGTLRDLLLGRAPVFWIGDLSYLATAVPVGALAFLWARSVGASGGMRLRFLLYLDALGLALFTLVGARIALEGGHALPIAVVVGCITGVVGGMIRDVLSNVTPVVLREDLYATVSLAGGLLYGLTRAPLGEPTAFAVSFAAMVVVRIVIVWRSGRRG